MSIQYPELKNTQCAFLHTLIQEKCEAYFSELENDVELVFDTSNIVDLETVFEERIFEIGKMVLTVHYQEDYQRFVEELQAECSDDETD